MPLPEVRRHHIEIQQGIDNQGRLYHHALSKGGTLDLLELNLASRRSVIARVALHNTYHEKARTNPGMYSRKVKESNDDLPQQLQSDGHERSAG